MSNSLFFKNFFKDNKIWNEVQNNPIARQHVFPNKVPGNVMWRITDWGGRLVNHGTNINRRHRFYPPPAGRHRMRVHGDIVDEVFRRPIQGMYKRSLNKAEKIDYVKQKEGQRPEVGVPLPNPLLYGLNQAQQHARSIPSIRALVYSDKFSVQPDEPYHEWVNADDYWLPYYEGDFMLIPEKAVKRQPKLYNKDIKFFPKQYISDKQKEALVWLTANLQPR